MASYCVESTLSHSEWATRELVKWASNGGCVLQRGPFIFSWGEDGARRFLPIRFEDLSVFRKYEVLASRRFFATRAFHHGCFEMRVARDGACHRGLHVTIALVLAVRWIAGLLQVTCSCRCVISLVATVISMMWQLHCFSSQINVALFAFPVMRIILHIGLKRVFPQ